MGKININDSNEYSNDLKKMCQDIVNDSNQISINGLELPPLSSLSSAIQTRVNSIMDSVDKYYTHSINCMNELEEIDSMIMGNFSSRLAESNEFNNYGIAVGSVNVGDGAFTIYSNGVDIGAIKLINDIESGLIDLKNLRGYQETEILSVLKPGESLESVDVLEIEKRIANKYDLQIESINADNILYGDNFYSRGNLTLNPAEASSLIASIVAYGAYGNGTGYSDTEITQRLINEGYTDTDIAYILKFKADNNDYASHASLSEYQEKAMVYFESITGKKSLENVDSSLEVLEQLNSSDVQDNDVSSIETLELGRVADSVQTGNDNQSAIGVNSKDVDSSVVNNDYHSFYSEVDDALDKSESALERAREVYNQSQSIKENYSSNSGVYSDADRMSAQSFFDRDTMYRNVTDEGKVFITIPSKDYDNVVSQYNLNSDALNDMYNVTVSRDGEVIIREK